MKRFFSIILAMLTIFLGFSSCAAKKNMNFEGSWILISYEKDKNQIEIPEFEDESFAKIVVVDSEEDVFRLGGFSGVNNFIGQAKCFTDGRAEIKINGATLKAGLPENEKFERDFLENLPKMSKAKISGENLRFSNQDSSIIMVFKASKNLE